MNIRTIINKAFSTARRRVVGRQKGGVITRMERMTKARCVTDIDPSVPTANWSWDDAKGVHRINVGTSINLIANTSTMLDEKKMKAMIDAVIRHETEHGIQTYYATGAVGDACIDKGIPFRLLNLFEDCRIEHNSAIRPDGDGAFGWRKWQDVQVAYALPTSLLWATKVNEAGIKKSMSSYVPKWMGASTIIYKGAEKNTRLVILDFYRRIIASPTTMSLVTICEEWISIFGTDVADDVITEHLMDGKSDPLDKKPTMAPPVEKTGVSTPTEDDHDQNKVHEEWMKRKQSMNADQVGRIASSMNGIINNARTVKNRKSINGTRFNADEAIRGGERAFLSRGRARGRRSVALIVDMSSSMEKEWCVHGMKEVVLAFRKLHREGKIDLNLILTQYDRGAKSYRVKDSDLDSWVNSLFPDGGGEEIMASMRRFDSIIKKSTTTVILTDACLSDRDIDISAYRNAGLNAIGAYIEPDDHMMLNGRKRMDKHFARSVVAQEPCELARRLVREMIKD